MGARRLRELEDLERARLREQEELERALGRLAEHWKTHSPRAKHRPELVQLDEEALRRLHERAKRETAGRMRDADTGLIETWGERARLWAQVAGVFGDPGQMLGRGWDLTLGVLRHTGWSDLLLGFSFGGGSDPTGAMNKVLQQLQGGEWMKADVLLVSDGEWPAPAGLIPAVRRAREAGTRLHGVQIGNRGETGLHAICDPVHVFTDWAGIA